MKQALFIMSMLGFLGFSACDDDPKKTNNINNTSNINNINNATPCQTMCTALMACETITDQELVFGTTAQTCETKCEGNLEPYIKECLLAASDCVGFEECMRCLTFEDVGFCDGACDLLVNDCGGTDLSQCSIDCEMYGSGAAGCFRGAGRTCCEAAVGSGNCADTTGCPTIH